MKDYDIQEYEDMVLDSKNSYVYREYIEYENVNNDCPDVDYLTLIPFDEDVIIRISGKNKQVVCDKLNNFFEPY